ncbi:hypothetical protein JT358_16220 [Micrococcales bacterium 31B]|nr:hypothetical protein [Micrococcales bacterium 31B]
MNSKAFSPAGWIWYSRPLFALIMLVFSVWVAAQGRATVWSWVLGGLGLVLIALNVILMVAHRQQGGRFPWQRSDRE